MSGNGIGEVARELYAKLASGLAGPFERYLPRSWVDEALEAEGHCFRRSVFSPLGCIVGMDWSGA